MTVRILVLAISLLIVGVSTSQAQTDQTQGLSTRQSLDDIWAVVEYPQGKEVSVDLLPTSLLPNAGGKAKVLRAQNETTIDLEVTNAGDDTYHLYAVDSLGNASLLTEARFGGESNTISAKTPLSRFMLILSPDSDLTSIEPNTRILLRSSVPEGMTVIPRETGAGPEAVTMPVSLRSEPDTSNYDAPMLGITSLPKGKESQMRARYSTGFEMTRSSILIKPLKRGASQIKILLHLGEESLEDGSRYVLWAFTPNHSYSMLGQLSPTGKKGEMKIETQTDLRDFGLFITIEGEDVTATPAGPVLATIVR
ncbi:MAG: hypothetical protein ICV60_22505 [Pyrinomonadaceae bacterium]|nr:hypothetical protein [Pyrinomonadaceae bacterium]